MGIGCTYINASLVAADKKIMQAVSIEHSNIGRQRTHRLSPVTPFGLRTNGLSPLTGVPLLLSITSSIFMLEHLRSRLTLAFQRLVSRDSNDANLMRMNAKNITCQYYH